MISMTELVDAGAKATAGETSYIYTLLLGSLFLIAILAIVILVLQIMTIIYQAKRKQWVWMVFTILFGITMIIYWVVWLLNPKLKRRKK